jgi:hypothetical protein
MIAKTSKSMIVCLRMLASKVFSNFIFNRGGKDSECSDGYEGIFCSKCSTNISNKIYARSNGYECLQCSPLRQQLGLFTLVLILRICWVLYML